MKRRLAQALSIFKRMQFPIKKRFLLVFSFLVIGIWGLINSSCSSQVSFKNKVFKIARDDSWYLINLMGKEKNMSAFTAELIAAISKEGKFRAEVFPTSSDNLFEGLDNESFDGVLSSLQPTSLTKQEYAFSDPFYLLGPVLVVTNSSPVHSLADMQGKIIGIRAGNTLAYTSGNIPFLLVVPYDNINLAFDDLDKNKIDGLIVDALTAYTFIQTFYPGKQKVVTAPLTDAGLRLVARHDSLSEMLIEHFNEGLKLVKKNGTYSTLLKKWDLIDTADK